MCQALVRSSSSTSASTQHSSILHHFRRYRYAEFLKLEYRVRVVNHMTINSGPCSLTGTFGESYDPVQELVPCGRVQERKLYNCKGNYGK